MMLHSLVKNQHHKQGVYEVRNYSRLGASCQLSLRLFGINIRSFWCFYVNMGKTRI